MNRMLSVKDGLDRRTVKEIQRFLKGQASRVRESIRSVMTQRSTTETGRSPDPMVWATETLHDEMQAAFLDRLNRQISQIEAALERLAQREYGLCRDCGEFIGAARLKALPFAQRCRRCQLRAEEWPEDSVAEPVGAALAAAGDD